MHGRGGRINCAQKCGKHPIKEFNSMSNLKNIFRKNINELKSYQVSRDAYLNKKGIVFLDNCENNFGSALGKGLERYPSSSQEELKSAIATYKSVEKEQVVLGNGSDELIDLLMRATCEPGKDNILISEPTFGMYRIYAKLNNVEVLQVPLTKTNFEHDLDSVLKAITKNTKIIFVCSPNNPSGSSISKVDLTSLLQSFKGLVVVDEAYIDFSEKESHLKLIDSFSNLVVFQTFSKAWGLAGLRIGVAYANQEITDTLNKIRPPYNISTFSQQLLLTALEAPEITTRLIKKVKKLKEETHQKLKQFSFIKKIYPSDGNFFLLKVEDANRLCEYLKQHDILISNRNSLLNCKNHVRISIGTNKEMNQLFKALKNYK